jgi:aminoglycoside phosphotransferase (APT) family kinase protein
MWNMPSEEFGYVMSGGGLPDGIPTESDYVASYCEHSGRGGIDDLNFYVAFAAFRIAAISQGIYRRVLDGVASTNREAINQTAERAELALELLHRP